ncbi:MAG: hypothetical protein WCG85_26265, partial [Polyangia bacterium]
NQPSDHSAVNQLVSRLNRLASLDASAIERITRAVDLELENLKASTKSLSAAELAICDATGNSPDQLAQWKAKQAADARIVAGIPHDQAVIMRCLYGDDPALLAKRWTELQRQIHDGKVAR